MKRITIAMIVIGLLVAIALLADIVTFSEEPRAGATNIQGFVYEWDYQLNEFVPVGPGERVDVYLIYDALHGGGQFDQGYDLTNDFSFYEYDFQDYGGNNNYCDLVKVKFRGVTYEEYYDGIVVIDIYWTPVPPGQTPGEE